MKICFFMYGNACKRVLPPLALRLRQMLPRSVAILVCVPGDLPDAIAKDLFESGCVLVKHVSELYRELASGSAKMLVSCLDQNMFPDEHRRGIEVAKYAKKCGVETAAMQHGGVKSESLKGLASAESNHILAWGDLTARELIHSYGRDCKKVHVVGNPLHDMISSIQPRDGNADRARSSSMAEPAVLFAGCNSREYDDYPAPEELYRRFIQDVYSAVRKIEASLLVRPHPNDNQIQVEWYTMEVEPQDKIRICSTARDLYTIFPEISLVMTRASTVAEEALALGVPAVAFDVLAEGPASGYRLLCNFSRFRLVTKGGSEALKIAAEELLKLGRAPERERQQVCKEITRLDGKSVYRAASKIEELSTSSR